MNRKLDNRLRVLMANRYLSATELAKLTGISRNTINSLKNNRTKMIRIDTLATLINFFGITTDEFFEWRCKR